MAQNLLLSRKVCVVIKKALPNMMHVCVCVCHIHLWGNNGTMDHSTLSVKMHPSQLAALH